MDSKELWKQNYRKTILSVLILIIKTEKIQTVKSNWRSNFYDQPENMHIKSSNI